MLYSVTFLDNPAVYEITWKNTVELGSSQMTIRRMRSACWLPKATNTHSEYVIIITFELQQWKVLCYKSEGRWFDPRWCQLIFH